MIPVRLSMHNFMCYRGEVPPLDFSGIHTACVSGPNGNGKSALIDAITWALWGKARASSDDDLIHQAEIEMGVAFDFAIGEQVYRVIRKRVRPKKRGRAGQSALEFQLATDGGFKVISGNTISETQQKISDTLHMTYDTFTNSAFLRQGHADEFTRKRPVERKEVLASILQLSVYDELEEQARSLARQQEMAVKQLEGTLKDTNAELSQKPAYEAALKQVRLELAKIDEVAKQQEAKLNQLRQERETLKAKEVQLQQLRKHAMETKGDIEQWQKLAAEHRARITEYEALLSRHDEIEQGYRLFSEFKKSCDELDRKARQWATRNEEKHRLEMAILRVKQELLGEQNFAKSKIAELETEARRLPELKEALDKVETELRQLAAEEESLHASRRSLQETQGRINHLESGITRLNNEIAETEEKIRMLSRQTEPRCPLCETALGTDGLKLIETKYTTEREGKSAVIQSDQKELATKRAEAETLESNITRQEKDLNQAKAAAQAKAGALKKAREEGEASQHQLAAARTNLAAIEKRLAEKDYAVTEQKALADIEAGLAELAYNSEEHDRARENLSRLQQYETAYQKLAEAERLIAREREAAVSAKNTAKERQKSLEQDTRQGKALAAEAEALPRLESDFAQADAEYRELASQQKQVQETLGSTKAKLERYTELEAKRQEREKELAKAAKDEQIYRELALAFGKGGVQAMLIETALPEIEAEANKLLAQMTDNRMHVKIETQRETKQGSLRETLDINISDELGTRDYEMFSGGEAFRIDFAVRIALSRLLARRTGAPLRTLIIDEGFGTQDTTGIEKIKEAIGSIQDDFDKILVITHIEELRDAFPTRIEVSKTPAGSTVQIS